MLEYITSLLEISLGCSIVIIGLILLSPILRKQYGAKWKYLIWLILVIRLIVPYDMHLLQGHKIELPQVNMIHNLQVNSKYS